MKIYKIKVAGVLCAFAICAVPSANAIKDKIVESDFDINFNPLGTDMIYYAYKGKALPDIYRKNADGHETNLTKSGETWDIEPDYAPDGKSIAYVSGPHMAGLGLRIMNADGSNNRLILELDQTIIGPAWSPDGQYIAFNTTILAGAVPDGDIFVTNLDGSVVKNLTEDLPGAALKPSWSHDGKYIYFLHSTEKDGPTDIYRMNAEGSHIKRLTNLSNPVLQVFDVQPAPKRDTLLFTASDKKRGSEIYMIPVDVQTPVQNPQQITNTNDQKEYFVHFTPDGKHLTYSVGEWGVGFALAHMPVPSFKR